MLGDSWSKAATLGDEELAGVVLNVRPDQLRDLVYDAIREAIVNRTIPPGARVTEAAIAKRLRVSTTPVREALLRLRRVGLIESAGGKGARVVMPSRDGIRNAYEVREALETQAATLAAGRGSDEALSQIADLAERCLCSAQDGDPEGFRAFDLAFHQAISRATGNQRLIELIEDALALVTVLRRRDVPHAAASLACAEAHVRIAQAISRRHIRRAADLMRGHVREVERYVLEGLEQSP